ncbi:IS5 family transposase [Candidatus Peregrinibacteria bacterium]|nr:IS5 family transposase [Candidatus Peregrinibacteria bacterium]
MKTKNKTKTKYRIRNWAEYNQALKQRGSLELWLNADIADKWRAEPSGRPGNQPVYSDYAIEIVIQFGKVFHQKLRQTEGLLEDIFKLMSLKLLVPDYSTVSRRASRLKIILLKKAAKKGEKKIVVIDASGLKVYGEGEWKVKMHGQSKRRTWRKIHLGIGPDGEIRAAKLTLNNVADCEVAPDLLNQIEGKINTVAGDGGYDKETVYQTLKGRRVRNVLIPPQENAKIKLHGNLKCEPHRRDENLRQIRKIGRKRWKEKSGYHVRSLIEATMFRLKTIIGGKLNARKMENQITESLISCNILNKMAALGMPDSYAA